MTIRETIQKRLQADVQRKADIAAYQGAAIQMNFIAQLKMIMPELADQPDTLPMVVDGLTLNVETIYDDNLDFKIAYNGQEVRYFCAWTGRKEQEPGAPDYYPELIVINDWRLAYVQADFAEVLVKIGYLDEAVPADPNPAAVAWSPPLTEPVQPYSNPELTERITTFREAAWESYQTGGTDEPPSESMDEADELIRDMQAELERLAKLVEEAND